MQSVAPVAQKVRRGGASSPADLLSRGSKKPLVKNGRKSGQAHFSAVRHFAAARASRPTWVSPTRVAARALRAYAARAGRSRRCAAECAYGQLLTGPSPFFELSEIAGSREDRAIGGAATWDRLGGVCRGFWGEVGVR